MANEALIFIGSPAIRLLRRHTTNNYMAIDPRQEFMLHAYTPRKPSQLHVRTIQDIVNLGNREVSLACAIQQSLKLVGVSDSGIPEREGRRDDLSDMAFC